MQAWRTLFLLCCLAALLTGGRAVTVEQVISREINGLDPYRAYLAVGQDGNVYLACSGQQPCVLRISPDGTRKDGMPVAESLTGVTANADGIIAATNAHFVHALTAYQPKTLHDLWVVSDFRLGDDVGFDMPNHVETGASGDFYANDQHNHRILRISPTGKIVTAYLFPPELLHKMNPRLNLNTDCNIFDFRVCEKTHTFDLLIGPNWETHWYAIDCDANAKAQFTPTPLKLPVSYNRDTGEMVGGLDVDANGNLYCIAGYESTVQIFTPEGKANGTLKLQMGEHSPQQTPAGGHITGLRVANGELYLKREHPTELFQRYALATGQLQQVISMDSERLSMTFPSDVWTAGTGVPFSVDFNSGARTITPRWHVWARPYAGGDYQELTVAHGVLQVPAAFGGLYQVKVTPEVQPLLTGKASDYLVRTVVEVRQPGAHGTINVLTPNGRIFYGAREAIPFSVTFRGADADTPLPFTVRLLDAAGAVVSESAQTHMAVTEHSELVLPAAFTAGLRPGHYTLRAEAAGLTAAPCTLVIGPGVTPEPFYRIRYGDYGNEYPALSAQNSLDSYDLLSQHIAQAQMMGWNLFVSRVGCSQNIGDIVGPGVGLNATTSPLAERLKRDPLAVDPALLQQDAPFPQAVAAEGAMGLAHMGIMLYNDAGLPVGDSGFEGRKPEQIAADVTRAMKVLAPYPGFRGWSWSSNWWLFSKKRDENVARSPEEKAAFLAARKAANETGAWDPVLDTIFNIHSNYPADADALFNAAARAIKPDIVTATAAPFRNVDTYPPSCMSNVDECDLQLQSEQQPFPYYTPFNVDFYKRPGKRDLSHPEVWNDAGTGDQIYSNLAMMLMRGSSSIGLSGSELNWGVQPDDPRISDYGTFTIFRTLNTFARQYGPLLATLKTHDPLAIIASHRMFMLDTWQGDTGLHFKRIMEAYLSCLYAHYPASIVFTDDLQPDTLCKYKAVLLVGQMVEFEPELTAALAKAKAAGVTIFADGACRPTLAQALTPLGMTFNHLEKAGQLNSDDSAFWRVTALLNANVTPLRQALGKVLPPPADPENPQVLVSERTAGQGRYLIVVNNTATALEPGHLWRVSIAESVRIPTVSTVTLHAPAAATYDLFTMKPVSTKDGTIRADLRYLPFRIFAELPAPIAQVGVQGPKSVVAGQTFAWAVKVLRADGKPIPASLPVRVRLLDADGTVLAERYAATGASEATGEFTVYNTQPAGKMTLEAVELVSGKSVKLPITITPRADSLDIVDVRAPVLPAVTLAASAWAQGKAPGAVQPTAASAGPHFRDMALTADGSLAVLNAMNWDQNVLAVDTETGQLRWSKRLGQYFAFAPVGLENGFAVQGFHFTAAEGYRLYLGDADGNVTRAFALYGNVKRLPFRFVPAMVLDKSESFAVPRNGAWVATAGDLGIALWNAAGTLLWQQDWSTKLHNGPVLRGVTNIFKSAQETAKLWALNDNTLLVSYGATLTAYDALTGKEQWACEVNGAIGEVKFTPDGRTLALTTLANNLTSITIVRAGKVVTTIPASPAMFDLAPDGSAVVVADANQLRWYSVTNGLRWIMPCDEVVRMPRLSPDGNRVAACSMTGTLYVVARDGKLLLQRDLASFAVPGWLPNGDLLLATWQGRMLRLDAHYAERWNVLVSPPVHEVYGSELAEDGVPVVKVTTAGNAAPAPAPLTPNLLSLTPTSISIPGHELMQNAKLLKDGDPAAPAQPWLSWSTINGFAETSPVNVIEVTSFQRTMRVTGITFVEDPAHPESWLRDVYVEYYDIARGEWVYLQSCISDAAVHTHMFAKPVDATQFRIVLPVGLCGNLRLGELVFHGELLGPANPDANAGKPLAELFDEHEEYLGNLAFNGWGWKVHAGGAYSGGKYLECTGKAAQMGANFLGDGPGHAMMYAGIPIRENPAPGEYRYLQFAVKAFDPTVKSCAFGINNVLFTLGDVKLNERISVKVADAPPTEWTVYRVDLWKAFKQPTTYTSVSLYAPGPVGFDQIVLGRTEADLPALPTK